MISFKYTEMSKSHVLNPSFPSPKQSLKSGDSSRQVKEHAGNESREGDPYSGEWWGDRNASSRKDVWAE